MTTETKKFKLDLPPMQTRRWNRSKHTSVLSKITTNPLHEAMKDALRCRLNRASLEWVKQRTQYCKYASWQSSSKPRSGKGTQADLPSVGLVWLTFARKLGKALAKMPADKMGLPKPKLHICACITQTTQMTLFRLCNSNKCGSVLFFDAILFLTQPPGSKGTCACLW